jgi:hypothetical protein
VRFDPIESGQGPAAVTTVTEEFVQAPLPAVDLLLVVDDTASMEQEQAALAAEFGTLAAELDKIGVRWQVGVVGMSSAPFGWLVGAPYLLTPGSGIGPTTPGTAGPGPETGFDAALAALSLANPRGPNAGFLRSDAVLHVVFVSDGDDASTSLGPDPVSAFLAALAGYTQFGLSPVVSAIIGDVPDGCSSSNGQAQPGVAYAAAVAATGGADASICAADFAPFLAAVADRAVVLDTRFALASAPMPGRAVVVAVDGERSDDWTLEMADPAIVFSVPPPAGATIAVTYLVELVP